MAMPAPRLAHPEQVLLKDSTGVPTNSAPPTAETSFLGNYPQKQHQRRFSIFCLIHMELTGHCMTTLSVSSGCSQSPTFVEQSLPRLYECVQDSGSQPPCSHISVSNVPICTKHSSHLELQLIPHQYDFYMWLTCKTIPFLFFFLSFFFVFPGQGFSG